jgi:hypothetical protein
MVDTKKRMARHEGCAAAKFKVGVWRKERKVSGPASIESEEVTRMEEESEEGGGLQRLLRAWDHGSFGRRNRSAVTRHDDAGYVGIWA